MITILSLVSFLAVNAFAADVAPSDPCAKFEKGTQVYTSCITVQFVESQIESNKELTAAQIDVLANELVRQEGLHEEGEKHDEATDAKIAALEKELADLKAVAAPLVPPPSPVQAPVGILYEDPIVTAYTGTPRRGDTGIWLYSLSATSGKYEYACVQAKGPVGVAGGDQILVDLNGDGKVDRVQTCAPTYASDLIVTGVAMNASIEVDYVVATRLANGRQVYGVARRQTVLKKTLGMSRNGA